MLKIFLVDIQEDMVKAWNEEILIQGVTVSPKYRIKTILGSMVSFLHPMTLDAVVSPSNCQGILGGGIDAVYRKYFDSIYNEEGFFQNRIYQRIERLHSKKLEIGQPIVVGTNTNTIKHLILSPTMEKPATVIEDSSVIYKATLSVFELLLDLQCISNDYDFSIGFPGMGTGVGRIPYSVAAREMISAYKDFIDSCGSY